MLSAFEVGGGLASRAIQNEIVLKNSALNQAVTLQQLGQEDQLFPLKLKQLGMANQIHQYQLTAEHQALDDKQYDARLMSEVNMQLGSDPVRRLDAPMPAFKTMDAMKSWALQRKADADTLAGMTAIEKSVDKAKQESPLYQRQLEAAKARVEAEKARQTYYQTKPQPGDKDYGEIQIEDIVPGYKAVYRKGSPGLHLVKTDGTQVTVKDRVNLASKISTIRKQMEDLDPNSQTYKDLDAIVKAAQAEMSSGGTPAGAPKTEKPPAVNPKDPLGLFK